MPADRTPAEHHDGGASGDPPTVPLPPDAGDAGAAVAATSGTYPRPERTEERSEATGAAAGSENPEAHAPAEDDHAPVRLVTEPLRYRSRWDDIQAGFVDEPRRSVADADALVAEVIDEITGAFAGARAELEGQWSRGDEASTEDLREAFRRYRSFFERLLST
jgi:hypothetical protein